MSCLYDRILERGFEPPERPKDEEDGRILQAMGEAQVVRLDNVADYYWKHAARWNDPKGLPNAAPPFPSFFLEFRTFPGFPVPENTRAVGMFFQAGEGIDRWDPIFLQQFREKGIDPKAVRWFTRCYLFLENAFEEITGPLVQFQIAADTEGLVLGVWFRAVGFSPDRFTDSELDAIMAETMGFGLMPCLLAVAFMHCKNTVLKVENPPERLNRARARRGKHPLVRFHLLELEPVKEILRQEGRVESEGLPRALHIARGHFKDYRDSGLFGKHKGIYWWESHVRGSLSEGVVLKDYTLGKKLEKA